MGPKSSYPVTCASYSGQSECLGRPIVPATSGDSHRMGARRQGVHRHRSTVRSSPHRSVCHLSQSSASGVRVSHAGPTCLCRGQSLPSVGGVLGVRLSSNGSHSQGDSENEMSCVSHSSNRPVLAQPVLVPGHVGIACGSPTASSGPAQSGPIAGGFSTTGWNVFTFTCGACPASRCKPGLFARRCRSHCTASTKIHFGNLPVKMVPIHRLV